MQEKFRGKSGTEETKNKILNCIEEKKKWKKAFWIMIQRHLIQSFSCEYSWYGSIQKMDVDGVRIWLPAGGELWTENCESKLPFFDSNRIVNCKDSILIFKIHRSYAFRY